MVVVLFQTTGFTQNLNALFDKLYECDDLKLDIARSELCHTYLLKKTDIDTIMLSSANREALIAAYSSASNDMLDYEINHIELILLIRAYEKKFKELKELVKVDSSESEAIKTILEENDAFLSRAMKLEDEFENDYDDFYTKLSYIRKLKVN